MTSWTQSSFPVNMDWASPVGRPDVAFNVLRPLVEGSSPEARWPSLSAAAASEAVPGPTPVSTPPMTRAVLTMSAYSSVFPISWAFKELFSAIMPLMFSRSFSKCSFISFTGLRSTLSSFEAPNPRAFPTRAVRWPKSSSGTACMPCLSSGFRSAGSLVGGRCPPSRRGASFLRKSAFPSTSRKGSPSSALARSGARCSPSTCRASSAASGSTPPCSHRLVATAF